MKIAVKDRIDWIKKLFHLFRRLAAIEFQPLMTFVTQDDYDDHTDSIVRSYFIFKDGVMPLWEDEYNAFGGCWSLIWNNDQLNDKNSKKNSKYVWKKLVILKNRNFLKSYFKFFFNFYLQSKDQCLNGSNFNELCR